MCVCMCTCIRVWFYNKNHAMYVTTKPVFAFISGTLMLFYLNTKKEKKRRERYITRLLTILTSCRLFWIYDNDVALIRVTDYVHCVHSVSCHNQDKLGFHGAYTL